MIKANDIIQFWFKTLTPAQWWRQSDALDRAIRRRFLDLHTAASHCELQPWRGTLIGRLAEIIVLDQFSRNIYRNCAQAFASDGMALCLSQEALLVLELLVLEQGEPDAARLSDQQYTFMVMPYMHSESTHIHKEAVKLFSRRGIESSLDYELRHKKIIDRFGRYPHRNSIMGRDSTPEEIIFLRQPGSSF